MSEPRCSNARLCAVRALLLAVMHPLVFAQEIKAPPPRPPLPKLASGARGFSSTPRRPDASKRLIAVGGGWGAKENPQKPQLKGETAEDYYRLGAELLRRLKFAKAIPPLEKAVHLNPRYLAAYRALGEAYAYDGVISQEKEEGKPEAALLGRYRQSAGAYEQARRLAPRDSSLAFNLGVLYFNLGLYEKAAELLKEGLRLLPSGKEAKVSLLEQGGSRVQIRLFLGRAYVSCGQPGKAVEAFEAALPLEDPDGYKRDIYEDLGPLYESLGKPEQALAAYQALLPTAENEWRWRTNPEPYLRIAEIQLVRKDLAAAAEAFTKAAEEARKQLAESERYPPAKGAAVKDVEEWKARLAEQREGLVRALYNAGVAWLSAGQMKAAATAFEKAVIADPTHAEARFNFAWALHALGDDAGAQEQVRQLERMDPTFAAELREVLSRVP